MIVGMVLSRGIDMNSVEKSYRFRFCIPDNDPVGKCALALHYACEEIERLRVELGLKRGLEFFSNKEKERK